MVVALTAATHYLALGIGLGSLFMRGIYFGALKKASVAERKAVLQSLFTADNLWGLAAVLWVVTGLARAFGGLEKGTAYYLANRLFVLKMALFLIVFILEIVPMVTLIKWRIGLPKGRTPSRIDEPQFLDRLARLNLIELILIALIPIVASLMARGFGL